MILSVVTLLCLMHLNQINAFNIPQSPKQPSAFLNRRSFVTTTTTIATSVLLPKISNAASTTPTIYTTTNGVKYAITNKSPKNNKPQKGDFVAIEYTG